MEVEVVVAGLGGVPGVFIGSLVLAGCPTTLLREVSQGYALEF